MQPACRARRPRGDLLARASQGHEPSRPLSRSGNLGEAAATARELPSWLELVGRGGILIPSQARGVGAGAGRAACRGCPARPVPDPRSRAFAGRA
jgi:hypothetical protein